MAYVPALHGLGSCCASCAAGGPCASSLGASRMGAGVQQAGLATLVAEHPPGARPVEQAMTWVGMPAAPTSRMLLIAAGLGLAGVAGLYVWKRRKR